MSNTPRTDKLARGNHVVPTEWAEDLEREGHQLRGALREIQQLARGGGDKTELLAMIAAIGRAAEDVLEGNPPASGERIAIRRLEKLGFAAPSERVDAQTSTSAETSTNAQPAVRLVCSEWRCGWVGSESEALQAPDPFCDGSTLIACPKCREQTLRTCCDEPGCTMEASCGTPTDGGYRTTCGKHQPNAQDPARREENP